jgi:hypothetical protein
MDQKTTINSQKQVKSASPMASGVLQRAAVHSVPGVVPPIVHELLRTSGQPIDLETRAFMEPLFGHDFIGVRLHTNSKAAESTPSVSSLAHAFERDKDYRISEGEISQKNHNILQLTSSEDGIKDNQRDKGLHVLSKEIKSAFWGGSKIDQATQARFRDPLGINLSNIRIHTNDKADHLARSIGALAFTSRNHIFFKRGTYNPETRDGLHLLAHEATHTIQQSKGPVDGTLMPGGLLISNPADKYERAANIAADQVTERFYDRNGYFEKNNPRLKVPDIRGTQEDYANIPLQRQGSNTPTISLGPVIINRDPKKEREEQKIADDAMKSLPLMGQVYLDQWYSASLSGALTANEPSDPVAKENWYIALAGNLAWASTGLFPEGAAALGVVVSFAGAAVGSGAAARETAPSGGKALISNSLARARDNLEKRIRPKIVNVAADSAIKDINDHEIQGKMLWQELFPSIPFEGRFEKLTIESRKRSESALTSFMNQWYAWRDMIKECAGAKAREDPFGLRSPGPRIQASLDKSAYQTERISGATTIQAQYPVIQPYLWPILITSPTDDQIKECEMEKPFKPDLKF